ncbi:hypothetical protein ABIF65_003320 [Bradyrhizobium japonicum]|jgi:hypothetical protein|uniref:hypothetical protein n=1 Tax=Bradyrhizobium TaxID=374 RepID=UPI00041B86CA|nr:MULTISPECIES: hypothetical protein [Bradyrhizobium]MBR0882381.1 hypothetical protein [Bradyrhizobium liaoningense]MBR0947377.1 hypothetical protein [Bradyrhizobium liaoningense]MBR1001018.1 hypothetical protein [Bradyrhizobium liaoningense]MBR1068684.1 hypothetical protein [Bradyrhizobium liaoningense]MCP1741323.1 hypothetical protein [Bradyrhizobium japonicum]
MPGQFLSFIDAPSQSFYLRASTQGSIPKNKFPNAPPSRRLYGSQIEPPLDFLELALYGSHVLGGVHNACDMTFFDLRPASAEDEFCREQRPE